MAIVLSINIILAQIIAAVCYFRKIVLHKHVNDESNIGGLNICHKI